MARGKVAITGSSGILGSRLYAALQANGWEVVGLGLADSVSQGGPGRDGAAETNRGLIDVECDLAESCPSLEGFTHVVHLAGVGIRLAEQRVSILGDAVRGSGFVWNEGGHSADTGRDASLGATADCVTKG